MDKITEWIVNNKEWLFSGVGVVIIAAIIRYFWTKSKIKKETSPDNSINQEIGTGNKTLGSSKFEGNSQNVGNNAPKPRPKPRRRS